MAISIEKIEEMSDMALVGIRNISAHGVDTICKTIINRYKKCVDMDKYVDTDINVQHDVLDFAMILIAFKLKYKGVTDSLGLLSYHGDMLNIMNMVCLIMMYEKRM